MKPGSQWRTGPPAPRAVKGSISLHTLPGGGECCAPPDVMHTWHHGVGREFGSSAVALWWHDMNLLMIVGNAFHI